MVVVQINPRPLLTPPLAASVEVPLPQHTAQPHSSAKIWLLCRLLSVVVPALRRPTTELMPGLNVLLQSAMTPILLEPKKAFGVPPRRVPLRGFAGGRADWPPHCVHCCPRAAENAGAAAAAAACAIPPSTAADASPTRRQMQLFMNATLKQNKKI